MARKPFAIALLWLGLLATVAAQAPAPTPPPPPAPVPAPVPSNAGNKVDGLELPAPFAAQYDDSFVVLGAKCAGPVKWLVLGTQARIKYKADDAAKEITIGIPPANTVIDIFAVGTVAGKPTEFAHTQITVQGAPEPAPTPGPQQGGRLHLTLIEQNPSQRTAAQAAVFGSKALAQRFPGGQGDVMRLYTVGYLQQKRPDLYALVQKAGSLPCAILQQETGPGQAVVLGVIPLPATDTALLGAIQQAVGK